MKFLKLSIAFAAFAWPQGFSEIKYEVDGSAKYAMLTLINEKGGKEQNRVKLPFELHFYAKSGSFVYLSAQKTRVVEIVHFAINDREEILDDGVAGTVHVLIRARGAVLQEASSSAPYGIASADGKVPE